VPAPPPKERVHSRRGAARALRHYRCPPPPPPPPPVGVGRRGGGRRPHRRARRGRPRGSASGGGLHRRAPWGRPPSAARGKGDTRAGRGLPARTRWRLDAVADTSRGPHDAPFLWARLPPHRGCCPIGDGGGAGHPRRRHRPAAARGHGAGGAHRGVGRHVRLRGGGPTTRVFPLPLYVTTSCPPATRDHPLLSRYA